MVRSHLAALSALCFVAVGGCSATSIAEQQPAALVPTSDSSIPVVAADEAFPSERCDANRAAGKIRFLTSVDAAAAASIVNVIVAEEAGYFDALCLDVDIRSGLSSSNFAKVAGQTAQFASGGSFSEVVRYSAANDAGLLVTSVDGRTTLDTLIVKSGEATELGDLAGQTIGLKGELPPAIDVMLRNASLVEGTDFDTIQLDGVSPIEHLTVEEIVGVPGWKSNEVGTLERAGIGVQLFDPLDFGVPGSFGVLYTNAAFLEQHRTAAQDFVRATAQGLADAVADPAAAAVAVREHGDNPSLLSPDSEVYRWDTEARLILEGTPEGVGLGTPDLMALQAELDAYATVSRFGSAETPVATDFIATNVSADVHDDAGAVIWPS